MSLRRRRAEHRRMLLAVWVALSTGAKTCNVALGAGSKRRLAFLRSLARQRARYPNGPAAQIERVADPYVLAFKLKEDAR